MNTNQTSEAALAPPPEPKSARRKKLPAPLPPWKVLLHNDNDNEMGYIVETIVLLTPLNEQDANIKMHKAHDDGCALLLSTHRERAELYRDQFRSRLITVTIEPSEQG